MDGATGTELRKAGMPGNCCAEQWILEHPQALVSLQTAYAEAGSEIIYAPTFRAQPLALKKWRLETRTAEINRELITLSRKAAPGCLIAGNMTTMEGCMVDQQESKQEAMRNAYECQMKTLTDSGADILAAETLMNINEAVMILELAQTIGAPAVMVSFTCGNDGKLYSGERITDAVCAAEQAGAAAVGINCVAASATLPALIRTLRTATNLPLICKPNAGLPVNGRYPVGVSEFASILYACIRNGSRLIGGCCGTTPEYISALKKNCPVPD